MIRVATFAAAATVVANAQSSSKGSSGKTASSSSSSKASGEALFTGSQAYEFIKSSVLVTKDISVFTGSAAASMAWAQVPANNQKQVVDQYEEIVAKVDTLRLQNGIPTPTAFYTDMEAEYYKKVSPLVQKGVEVVTQLSEKPFAIAKKFVESFEKAYPEHQGKLATGSVFDFALVAFFLFYFVFSYFYRFFCFFFCCGCCARRASAPKKAELQKPAAKTAAKTNGVAKRK